MIKMIKILQAEIESKRESSVLCGLDKEWVPLSKFEYFEIP
jgi:hypothetical protein